MLSFLLSITIYNPPQTNSIQISAPSFEILLNEPIQLLREQTPHSRLLSESRALSELGYLRRHQEGPLL